MKITLCILCAVALCGCANDGTMRAEARVPLGESAKYGTLILGIGYIPPTYFPNVIENQPTLKDK